MRKIILFTLLLAAGLANAQQKQFSLEDAILGIDTYLAPEKMKAISWRNSAVFTYLKNDTLWGENAKTKQKQPVISLQETRSILSEKSNFLYNFPNYSWTSDERLLIRTVRFFSLIDPVEKRVEYTIELPEKAENAVFNEAGNFVAFTVNDDLFLAFSNRKPVQVTKDGGNGIVNGKTVHRNEFGIKNGIFISPGGNYVAFYRKDESMVSDYPLVNYMPRVAQPEPVKYPMAGMKSEEVKVGIYSIESEKTIFLQTGGDPEHYLTNLAWSPDEKFVYIDELNRAQNHLNLNYYSVESGNRVKTVLEETHEKYVEPQNPVQFSTINQNEFYRLTRNDGWFHLYKYTTDGKLIGQITKGEWESTKVLGFDEKEKHLFVEATKESPLERHIYRVEVKTGKMEKLTVTAGMHQGVLSPGGNWLIDTFSAPDIPSQTDILSSDGKILRNLHLADDPLQDYILGENRLVQILSADGKTELTGRLVLPVNFDPQQKYPVIVYVYGGPHSQMVNKSWHNAVRWWQYYMASQGFIAFTMDNRGTNFRGLEFENIIHRQLGVAETEDQMKGIEYLKSLPFVDAERIGVHGWSYGGFMTLNMMLRHPEVFKVGVAGGPVVDWSMYEIMYGERYMSNPQENTGGYIETSMLSHVAELQGKLMLIHGVQDDVVVMQHSMLFLEKCIKLGKQVDFFVYPTHPHNVRGKDRVHLMEKVSRYFMDYL